MKVTSDILCCLTPFTLPQKMLKLMTGMLRTNSA